MNNSTGLTAETFAFLADLEKNNSKEWFNENRERYERDWLAPCSSFIEAVAPALAHLDPVHKAEAKVNKSIRRINRDVRFSADKSPYDPKLHLVFWTGDHPNRSPALHLVVRSDHVGYGAGEWMWQPAKVDAFRKRLQDDAAQKTLINCLDGAAAYGCELPPAELKKLPKGLPADTDYEDLLKRKSLVVRTIRSPATPQSFYGQEGIDRFIEIATRLAPLNRWIGDL